MVHEERVRKLQKVSAERTKRNGPEITVAVYRPLVGKEAELLRLLKIHNPTLKRLGLITDRPSILMKSAEGAFIEIFEWRTADGGFKAEQHPEMAGIWESMVKLAEILTLSELEETKFHFSQFIPVEL